MTLLRPQALAGALQALARLAQVLDGNRRLLNLSPFGEPRLGRRGLYRSTGGHAPGAFEHALLWVLSQSDGAHDLLAIAERARLPFEAIEAAAEALQQAGLLRRDLAPGEPRPGLHDPLASADPERHPDMKVVLFCGGLGTRLREHSDTIPKPLVNIGVRPILWHLMRYYAHFGHKEFILCLGYRGDLIRDYFLNYNECLSNDFVLSEGGRRIELMRNDLQDWKITFVDTGLHANIGQRLMRVRQYLGDDEEFLANYADGLSNLPLDRHIADFRARGATASFAAVPSPQSFHTLHDDDDGIVTSFGPMSEASPFWINAGFCCLRQRYLPRAGGRRRAGRGAVPAPDRAAPPRRVPLPRLLAGDGHLQGQDHLRPHGGPGPLPVDGLEAGARGGARGAGRAGAGAAGGG